MRRRLAPTKPSLDRNGNPTKWSIDRLDGRERVYSYVASVMAAFFAVFIYFAESTTSPLPPEEGAVHAPDHTHRRSGLRRRPAGHHLARAPGPGRASWPCSPSSASPTPTSSSACPFLVLAVWLLYRSYKIQKEARPASRPNVPPGRPAGATAARRRAEAAAERRAGGRPGGAEEGPAGPEGNKRYTPKKPAPTRSPTAQAVVARAPGGQGLRLNSHWSRPGRFRSRQRR